MLFIAVNDIKGVSVKENTDGSAALLRDLPVYFEAKFFQLLTAKLKWRTLWTTSPRRELLKLMWIRTKLDSYWDSIAARWLLQWHLEKNLIRNTSKGLKAIIISS